MYEVKIHIFSHAAFDKFMFEHGYNDDNAPAYAAFVSICCTEEIRKNYLGLAKGETDEHWFQKPHGNVLNLDFDDIRTPARDTRYGRAVGMTAEQADAAVGFIRRNLDKWEWYLHCRSGQSRSVAVGVFLHDYLHSMGKSATIYCPKEMDGINNYVLGLLNDAADKYGREEKV